MARPSTITRQEVFGAIRALIAEGVYPNPANVRAALGNRGSPPVVQRHIGDWYEEFGPELERKAAAKPESAATGDLRAELTRLTESAVQDLEKAQATRIAALDNRAAALDAREADLLDRDKRLDARESAHAEHLIDLRAQLEAAAAAQFRLEDARDRAVEEGGVYRVQVEELKAAALIREEELDRIRSEAGQVPTLMAGLERSKADASREHARVVELVGELDRVQSLASNRAAELAKATGALERADAAASTQAASVATLRQQLQDAQAELVKERARSEDLAGTLRLNQQEREVDGQRLVAVQQQLAGARQDHGEDLALLEAARAELASYKGISKELAGLKEVVQRIHERMPTVPASKDRG